MPEIKLSEEEREERIRHILKGLCELGCIPSEPAKISALFSVALGLSEQESNKIVNLD